MKFVNESQKGLIDPKTGNRLTAIGAAAGPLGAIAGATAGNLPTLQSVSDLRAAAIIARSQGLDETAASIDQQVQDILKQSSGITRFVDKFFNETVDGDAKGKARLDNLGFEYTVDEKTGNPIFSVEQIAANKAKSSKPKPEPVSTAGTGISITPPTDTKRKSLDVRKAEAQTRIDAKKRRDKRKKSVTKAKSISKDVKGKGAKAVSATQKAGPFNKGGLMNKKGKK